MMNRSELDKNMVKKMKAAKAKRLKKEQAKKKLQDRIAMFKTLSLSTLSLIAGLLAAHLGGTVNTYSAMSERGMMIFISLFMGIVSTIFMMMVCKSLEKC